MARSRRRQVLTVLVCVAALVAGLVAFERWTRQGPEDSCVARVGAGVVRLDPERAKYASVIVGVAVQRGLPVRAATIALATAMQESGLRNLDHGDRDSLGLFQQRPSQGWGTAEEVRDPVHATEAFYDALVKIPGYREIPVTEAAQRVQGSGFPDAYADHEADARVLAAALIGWNPATFTCTVHHESEADPEFDNEVGLTRRAAAIRRELLRTFGEIELRGFRPGGITAGVTTGSAHRDGRAIDVPLRPVNDANLKRGWAVATFLVANAGRLDIATIVFDGKIWESGKKSTRGWRDYDVPADEAADPAKSPERLEYRDHLHVDVR